MSEPIFFGPPPPKKNPKKICVRNFFRSNIFFGSNILLGPKFFGSEIILCQKNLGRNFFLGRKLFWVKKIWVGFFLGQKSVLAKFYLGLIRFVCVILLLPADLNNNNTEFDLDGGLDTHNVVKPTSPWLWLSWVLTINIY